MNTKRAFLIFGTSLVLSFALVTGVHAKKPTPPTDPPSGGGEMTDQQRLGEFLFRDPKLSNPDGQSCQSCHDPEAGFADPDPSLPVSDGADPAKFGTRNSPSAGYTAFTPTFTTKRGIQGGQFWDGSADDLVEQAGGPFLNPNEMGNKTKADVLLKVQESDSLVYGGLFEKECGPNAFAASKVETSYACMSAAIAAYEGTAIFSPFTSKFDAVQAGTASFTPQQQQGFNLFTGNAKCAHCHIVKVGAGNPILFTDFKYHNVGLPQNQDIVDLHDGDVDIDLGLGGARNLPQEYGKFKDPHLRNIEKTPPYMHNGVLLDLKQVVHFYNTRDVLPLCDDQGNEALVFGETCWLEPEVPETMDSSFLGNLGLTEEEEWAIVSFLETLTDGWPDD